MPKSCFRYTATLFSIFAPVALLGCSATSTETASEPKAVGFENYASKAALSKAKLQSAIAPFFEDEAMAETRALLVMHGGNVVAERYAAGYGPDSRLIGWSMSKSITAMLIGFMVADGLLVLDDPAPVPEWASSGDPRGKITLRQLLHMASGLEHSEDSREGNALYEADTPRLLFLDGRENVAAYAEKRPLEAAPGSSFEYSTATSHILADIMARALTPSDDPEVRRDAMLEYARGRLFEPLGMSSTFPEFDRSGTMLGGSMIHATARDWAKFGEFLRNNGSVRAAQLLPTSWPRFMKTPSRHDPAFGAHLWLNRKRPADREQILFPEFGPVRCVCGLGASWPVCGGFTSEKTGDRAVGENTG